MLNFATFCQSLNITFFHTFTSILFMYVQYNFFVILFVFYRTIRIIDTFKRLINVPRYTSASLAFAKNATDHINVVFRKFSYSLMRRVTASSDSIVTAIVHNDVYHQSKQIDK